MGPAWTRLGTCTGRLICLRHVWARDVHGHGHDFRRARGRRSLSLLAEHRLRVWEEEKTRQAPKPAASTSVERPNEAPPREQPLVFDVADEKSVMTFWHSSSHLLGHAMESRFEDDCLLCDGPALRPTKPSAGVSTDGFFYDALLMRNGRRWVETCLTELDKTDFDDARGLKDVAESRIVQLLSNAPQFPIYSVTEADMADLAAAMSALADSKAPFERMELSRGAAARMFWYNPFKVAFLSSIGPDVPVTVYKSGTFVDLCRGPHIPNTRHVKAVKLTSTSGAQWSPDQPGGPAANPLSRVYGISFPSAKDMRTWNQLLEEAAKRDHRVVGKRQGLFTTSSLSPGSPFILPHGARIVQKLLDFLRAEYRNFGYHEVITPLVFNKELWETSGHWENYKEDMFFVTAGAEDGPKSANGADATCHGHGHEDVRGLKPMNCPGHCLIFSTETRSYRDLPVRIAEFSPLHRNEATGALSGLTRVRKFHQDDAHIFCAPDQIFEEISQNLALVDRVYGAFGFPSYDLALSTRPEKFMGSREEWDRAESALKAALEATGKPWTVNEADGAFYGPKIDIRVRDALGRAHQTATVQLDFQLPQRFGLKYVSEAGVEQTPVIIHRAILGSVERMLAILIEHTGGRWPFWLSPRQAIVIPVAESSLDYARSIRNFLAVGKPLPGKPDLGGGTYFVDLDSSDNTLQKKIREAQVAQYNFMLVVGPKEVERGTVSVRTREGGNLGDMALSEVVELFAQRTEQMK